MDKINPNHLERAAYVYVRQSTLEQVQHNLESQRLQYQLAERARQLGWCAVTIIDDDLGRSASGNIERAGFERLLADVCQEKVGAIFAIEASRLARNGREWHTLMEICALVDTLFIDPEGVYSPKLSNDRLLLGMKGTISEMELSLLHQRCQSAIWAKARRGEYYNNLPAGYLKTTDGLEKDPDLRIQTAIQLVFKKFAELGSVRQTTMWFRQEGVQVPTAICVGQCCQIMWKIPGAETLLHMLRNPIYAGAYAYGRSKKRIALEQGKKRMWRELRRDCDTWDVLLQNHHEGYISWEQYQRNQMTIKNNGQMMGELVAGAAKGGSSVLTGLLRCGHCGRKMMVCYGGADGRYVRYNCNKNTTNIDGERCITFAAQKVEQAISDAVLEALSPLGMEAAVKAAEELAAKTYELIEHHQLNLQQARYECDRIRRQYDAIEPENRLVARTLETRWNIALERVAELERILEEAKSQPQPVTAADRAAILALAHDLPRVWHSEKAPAELKKRIVRTILKEVIVYLEQCRIRLVLHWEGGEHTELRVPRLSLQESRCHTEVDTVEAIKKLARLMPDNRMAQVLNRLGKRTAQNLRWNRARVTALRSHYKIAVYQEGEELLRGELNLSAAAKELSVHPRIIKQLIDRHLLTATQPCFGAPWVINRSNLQSEAVRQAIAILPRRVQPIAENQESLFSQ